MIPPKKIKKHQNDKLSSLSPYRMDTYLSQYLLQGQDYAKLHIPVSGLFPRDQVCTDIQDTTFDSSPFPKWNTDSF